MLPYIGRRLLATIPVMAVVAVVVFSLLRLTAGDPAAIIAGDNATSQDVAAIRATGPRSSALGTVRDLGRPGRARRLRRVVLLQEAGERADPRPRGADAGAL